MSALTPEQLNAAFLKHFMPETLYLLEEDQVLDTAVIMAGQDTAAEGIADEPNQGSVNGNSPENTAETSAPRAPAAPIAAIPKLPKVASTPLPKTFDLIGENRKGLVVLVTLPDTAFSALPQDQFLIKILAAIGFAPDDVAFVNNVSGATTRFEVLRQTTKTNYIISFASRLDTDLPHDKFTLYNPVPIDGVPVVFSQSLAVLDGDQEQKKLLWGALQQVFKK